MPKASRSKTLRLPKINVRRSCNEGVIRKYNRKLKDRVSPELKAILPTLYMYPTDARRPVPLTGAVKADAEWPPFARKELDLNQWFLGSYKEERISKMGRCWLQGGYFVLISASGGRPNKCISEMFNMQWEGNVIIGKENKWGDGVLKCRSEYLDICNLVVCRYIEKQKKYGINEALGGVIKPNLRVRVPTHELETDESPSTSE